MNGTQKVDIRELTRHRVRNTPANTWSCERKPLNLPLVAVRSSTGEVVRKKRIAMSEQLGIRNRFRESCEGPPIHCRMVIDWLDRKKIGSGAKSREKWFLFHRPKKNRIGSEKPRKMIPIPQASKNRIRSEKPRKSVPIPQAYSLFLDSYSYYQKKNVSYQYPDVDWAALVDQVALEFSQALNTV